MGSWNVVDHPEQGQMPMPWEERGRYNVYQPAQDDQDQDEEDEEWGEEGDEEDVPLAVLRTRVGGPVQRGFENFTK
jgi:hypothetical protein